MLICITLPHISTQNTLLFLEYPHRFKLNTLIFIILSYRIVQKTLIFILHQAIIKNGLPMNPNFNSYIHTKQSQYYLTQSCMILSEHSQIQHITSHCQTGCLYLLLSIIPLCNIFSSSSPNLRQSCKMPSCSLFYLTHKKKCSIFINLPHTFKQNSDIFQFTLLICTKHSGMLYFALHIYKSSSR